MDIHLRRRVARLLTKKMNCEWQIALYTITTWARTVLENVGTLIGKSAPAEYLTKLTYLI
jgi:hypothetical protein